MVPLPLHYASHPAVIRAGALLAIWLEMQYVGQKPVGDLSLHVYPCEESAFTLYEDDGVSYAYLKGAVATTELRCRADGDQMPLTIDPRHLVLSN